jgi:hypothetical protein
MFNTYCFPLLCFRLLCRETILIHGNLSLALLCGQLVLVASDDAVGNDVRQIKNAMKYK